MGYGRLWHGPPLYWSDSAGSLCRWIICVGAVDPQDAKRLLDEVADRTRVDIEVEQDGVVRYVFRELVR